MRRLKLIHIITTVTVIAALALSGTVPSFAADKAETVSEHTVTSAADIDFDEGPSIDATSAILMDAGSGEILYEKNAYEERDPASVTKIVTCMVAIQNLNMDDDITVSITPTTEGSTLKLKKGEVMNVEDMLYGLMLRSGNDAAEVIATEVGGSIEGFAEMMNEYAESCGAEHTHFKNPNGLNPDKVNNVTTAYDLAIIARNAMKNAQFREIVSTARYEIPATNMTKKRRVSNSNRCLNGHKQVEINGEKRIVKDDRCIGVKTGYTSTAGDCFVGEAVEGDTYLISVVLNSPHETNKFVDTLYLWDYGFSRYETCTVQEKDEETYTFKVKGGALRSVETGSDEDIKITVNKGSADPDSYQVKVEVNEETPQAPIKKGQVMGQLVVYDESGAVVKLQDLVALENVKEGGPLSKIGIADEDLPFFFVLAITALLIIVVLLVLHGSRKKKRRGKRSRRRV